MNHRILGLCCECNEPVALGAIRCAAHLFQNNIQSKQYQRTHPIEVRESKKKTRQSYFDSNRCIFCGAPLMEEESRFCVNCHSKQNKANRGIKGVLKYETAD